MTESMPPLPPAQNPVEYGYAPSPRRGNGAAIASLVLGILGCVPLLTGVAAILLGIIGLRKTRDPAVGGQGLAVAGLILGMVSLLGWGIFGGFLGYGYVESKPAGAVAQQFLQDVSAGNVNAAAANSAGFSPAQLQANSQQMKQFGSLQGVNLNSFSIFRGTNGQTMMHLGGTATYVSGQKTCTFDLVKQGATYKVARYWVQ
jgi:hypothetical protein